MDTSEIYKLRNQFSIIGLTGRTGSGCTQFADIISQKRTFNENEEILRSPQKMLESIKEEETNDMKARKEIFRRKYKICYEYVQKLESKYKVIAYTDVLLFYSLHFLVKKKKANDGGSLLAELHKLVEYNFKKLDTDEGYTEEKISLDELQKLCDYQKLFEIFEGLADKIDNIKEKCQISTLHNAYFNDLFKKFSEKFYKLLSHTDYYLGSIFVNRIGIYIRATGDPTIECFDTTKINDANPSNVYNIASLINRLIKAWKSQNKECHICIDSLRSSLEIMFFKERYSAFYMIAINNEGRHPERIKKRISDIIGKENTERINIMHNKIVLLDQTEYKTEDFKKGSFFTPDVENCIQKSEIHINNPGDEFNTFNKELREYSFYTMIEQWIKVRALISHPGIITPSHEERCMQIAYNTKFNSGCISRQVGAIITDSNNSIRSIGWNDVPQGSVSCNLRCIDDLLDDSNPQEYTYSNFESGKDNCYKDGNSFKSNLKINFSSKEIQKVTDKGLNYSYCFKSLHNHFENKDNQVHTRSLHAEENAMLQISKYGGQGLKGGILYTTASPCELCAKKAYQLGIAKIIYIDPYPGISKSHILGNGYNAPEMKLFTGVIGRSYNKLFEPFLSYKDELKILTD